MDLSALTGLAGLQVKPRVLIGLAGAGRLFSREVLEEMGRNHRQPIILPMSNPTSKMECTAQEAQEATGPPRSCTLASTALLWSGLQPRPL